MYMLVGKQEVVCLGVAKSHCAEPQRVRRARSTLSFRERAKRQGRVFKEEVEDHILHFER